MNSTKTRLTYRIFFGLFACGAIVGFLSNPEARTFLKYGFMLYGIFLFIHIAATGKMPFTKQ
ncbi:hypothetical protein KKC91_03125 [bacterium]|nr:hypothetical protein [bacterium]